MNSIHHDRRSVPEWHTYQEALLIDRLRKPLGLGAHNIFVYLGGEDAAANLEIAVLAGDVQPVCQFRAQ